MGHRDDMEQVEARRWSKDWRYGGYNAAKVADDELTDWRELVNDKSTVQLSPWESNVISELQVHVGRFSHLAKAIEYATWSSSDESSSRINRAEYTLRHCVMPLHRRPNYRNKKLYDESILKAQRAPVSPSVPHNSRQHANKRRIDAHCDNTPIWKSRCSWHLASWRAGRWILIVAYGMCVMRAT